MHYKKFLLSFLAFSLMSFQTKAAPTGGEKAVTLPERAQEVSPSTKFTKAILPRKVAPSPAASPPPTLDPSPRTPSSRRPASSKTRRTILPDQNAGSMEVIDRSNIHHCTYGMEYKPQPTFNVHNYTDFAVNKKADVVAIPRAWPKAAAKKNELLPNITTSVAIIEIGGSANLASFFSTEMKHKKITIDFMKYRTEPILTRSAAESKTPLLEIRSYSRVGAGMRLEIDILTSDASLGGNLFAIAASAKAGMTTGNISVDVIGLNSPEITLSMPFTTDLSDGSIQKIIEALAIVKSKLHDPQTTLTPQFIAEVQCRPQPEPKQKKEASQDF